MVVLLPAILAVLQRDLEYSLENEIERCDFGSSLRGIELYFNLYRWNRWKSFVKEYRYVVICISILLPATL